MSVEYVAVLGAVGLMRNGVLSSPRAPLLRALLGLLGASRTPLPPEYLMGVLWRYDPPHDPRSALHLAMSRLRAYLREHGAGVVTTDGGYRLDAGPTDLELFRQRAAGGSFDELSGALTLWRGRPFANVPAKRCDGRLVDALLGERDAVTVRAARAALEQGAAEEAVALAEPLCHAESLDEAAHAVLIEALVAAGRQGAAAAVYDGIRRRLATELGIGPGTLLRQAHQSCLDEPPRPAGRARLPAHGHLLGREAELARVAELLAGHRVVTVIGPPGVGKSSFAARFGEDAVVVAGDDPALVERLVRERAPRSVLVAAARPLGISGEVTWTLRPLGADASELLFRRRAAEAVPGLTLTDQDRPHVRELCRRADGLPAVIESLAALLRTFPPRELARHAAADLGALIDGANPPAVRFTASLDRLWHGLGTSRRSLLLRLSALPRDFGPEEAGAGCAALNALVALVDHGLVLPFDTVTGRRYRLLAPVRAMIAHRYAPPAARLTLTRSVPAGPPPWSLVTG